MDRRETMLFTLGFMYGRGYEPMRAFRVISEVLSLLGHQPLSIFEERIDLELNEVMQESKDMLNRAIECAEKVEKNYIKGKWLQLQKEIQGGDYE